MIIHDYVINFPTIGGNTYSFMGIFDNLTYTDRPILISLKEYHTVIQPSYLNNFDL